MTLSEKIKFLRQREGLSQEKLASKLDVTRQTVVNWEKGTTPTSYLLNQIAILFNVEINSLIQDDAELKFLPTLEEVDFKEELNQKEEESSYTCGKTILCAKFIIGLFGTIFSFSMFCFYSILSKKNQMNLSFEIYFWLSLSVIFFIVGLLGYLNRRACRVVFFENKFILYSGVFKKNFSECEFNGYKNIYITQNILGKLFDYGDICIDGILHRLFLRGIKRPHQLRKYLISIYN